MSLLLPIEELTRFKIVVLTPGNGNPMSLMLQPTTPRTIPDVSVSLNGVCIRVEATTEDGRSAISISTTSSLNGSPSTPHQFPLQPTLPVTDFIPAEASYHPMVNHFHSLFRSDSTSVWLEEGRNNDREVWHSAESPYSDSDIFHDSNSPISNDVPNLSLDIAHLDHAQSQAAGFFDTTTTSPTYLHRSPPISWDFLLPDGPKLTVPDSPDSAVSSKSSSPSDATTSQQPLEIICDSVSNSRHDPGPTGKRKRRRGLECLHRACGKRFTSEHTRRVHMQTHQRAPAQPLPCTCGCGEHFSRQHDRFRHEVLKHGRLCPWTCARCRGFFSTEKTYNNHKCTGDTRWKARQMAIDTV